MTRSVIEMQDHVTRHMRGAAWSTSIRDLEWSQSLPVWWYTGPVPRRYTDRSLRLTA